MTAKVLVVDDSALMRRQLRTLLEAEGFVVDIARNGEDALDKCRHEPPDVITLDINMPVMDGLTCLSHLMSETPCPVIMVSSLTDKGALATFEALELGAFDYIAKPDGTVSRDMQSVSEALIARINAALESSGKSGSAGQETRGGAIGREAAPARKPGSGVSESASTHSRRQAPVFADPPAHSLVVVGVSTGGPGTLEVILSDLPADFPVPIVIAQHMPARFTEVFAARLNELCQLRVREVRAPVTLEPGTVYLARGDADMRITRRAGRLTAKSLPSSDRYLWHPSVSRLMASAMEAVPADKLIAVQLTGMGYDGAEEMAEAHRQGALTIAESESSAVVYGMCRVLAENGGADAICDKHRVADQLIDWLAPKD